MKKIHKKIARQKRVRAKMKGTKDKPRLSIFRSNRYLYAQLINDDKGVTIVGLSQKESEAKGAKEFGMLVAKMTKDKHITKVVFDRGRYAYLGKVKEFAQGAREGGIKF